MWRQVATSLFVIGCLTAIAQAGPPSIRELRPWGAQRGQSVTLTVVGDVLAPGAEVFSAIPGRIEEQQGGSAGQLTYKLEIRPDTPVGVYPIRFRTPSGLSNVLLFSVGDLPEVAETEPNDTVPMTNQGAAGSTAAVASMPALTLPVTVNGSASGTDQDVFRFVGKKGDRVVLEVEAQRIGSLLDPAVHLVSASGRELAFADETPGLGLDCRIAATLPEDGDYFAVVHDSKYAGGNPAFYRLKIGSFGYAETVYPLGWQRGREVEVSLIGGSSAEPIRMRITPNGSQALGRMFIPFVTQGSQGRLPYLFVLGDAPELLEPETDVVDERWFKDAAVMNGRITKQGEVDRYKFPVAAGQSWIFEVDAANLGSPLDAVLTVLGPQGNTLASADDGNGLDPRLQFSVPAGLDHVLLAVEDLHGRGGPTFVYRLKARPVQTDYALQIVQPGPPGAPLPAQPLGKPAVNIPRGGTVVVQVNVARSGYAGPIQLTIPENLGGITAEDGLIPANANDGLLILYATPDAPLRAFDLEINAQGGPATKPMVRGVSSRGGSPYDMADAFAARVPAAVCEAPPAVLSLAERNVKILHGHSRTLKISAQRGPTATEAINITGTGLALGTVAGASGTIAKDANEITLKLDSSPENPLVGTFIVQFTAQTPVAGRQETIQLPPVRVEIARPYALELLDQNVTIAAGVKMRIAAVVRREAPFDGPVKVGPVGTIPQHVTLTAVDVPKGESLALLELTVGDMAAPAEFDLAVRASTDMEGRKKDKDYLIPDTPMKVKILPKAAQ